jgi:antitoxin component of RelBE/YafQ-DinJ toxin-antitoxin module
MSENERTHAFNCSIPGQAWRRLKKATCQVNATWHICDMTVLFRCRVNPSQLKQASRVTAKLGTSVPEAVRIFLAQIARTGCVPVSLSINGNSELLLDRQARDKIMRSLDDTETW